MMYQVYTEKEILEMAHCCNQSLLRDATTTESKTVKFKTLLQIAHMCIPTAGPVMISVEDDAEVEELFLELKKDLGQIPQCEDDAVKIGEDAVGCHSMAVHFLRNHFWTEFSKLVASCLSFMPEELHDRAKEDMQDSSSVYGSSYDKFLKKRG